MKKLLSDKIVEALELGKKRYGSVAALARASSASEVNIGRWIKRQQKPKVSEVEELLDVIGAKLLLPDEELIDYDLVPKVSAKVGAGASLETSDETEGLYAFRKDFMGREHICARNAVMMDVVGDSMEPEFYEGDTLLVDKSDIEIRDGKIYVVTLGDELRVKRIHKSLNGLILRSDNQKYPDIYVEGPDLETFVVHGRVRWHSRIL